MTIRQINAHWSSAEDRIFLRFNTQHNEEYRLWLTRVIVKRLFEQAAQYISQALSKKHDVQAASLVEDFQKQKINQHINTGQSFQLGDRRPLGDEPVVVVDVKLILKDQSQPHLVMHLASRKKLDIPSNFATLQSMAYLLERVQDRAEWGLSLGPVRNQNSHLESQALMVKPKGSFH